MPQLSISQQALYESLRKGDMEALAGVYPTLYRRTASVLRRWGVTDQEAPDLLHEAILATVYNIRYGRYVWTGEAELTTYIISIARNLWLATQRSRRHFDTDTEAPDQPDDVAETQLADLHFEARREAAEAALNQLDPKCRRTLELYYWEKLSMAQLAEQQGWANEAVARKTKSNCLRKLRQWVEERLTKATL